MKYLKYFENFNFEKIFESNDLFTVVDNIEKKASEAGINLDDVETQKAICADLIAQFTQDNISQEYKNLDFEKISDRINAKKENLKYTGFYKIYESLEIDNLEDEMKKFKEAFMNLPYFDVKNEVENFGSSDTLLQKLRPSVVTDEKVLKLENEIKELLDKKKTVIGGFFQKLGAFTVKGMSHVLNFIFAIPNWVRKMLNNFVLWFCRTILGMSNSDSAFYGPLFTGCAIATLICIISAPIWASIAAIYTGGLAVVTSGAIISCITGAISSATNISYIWQIIINILWLIYWYSTMSEPKTKQEYISFMDFLDGLEKLVGKRIKLSPDIRQYFMELDINHNTILKGNVKAMRVLGSIQKIENEKQIQTKQQRVIEIHMILEKYLREGLDTICKDFSIFDKIVKGQKVLPEDKKFFEDWMKDYISGIEPFKKEYGDKGYEMGVKAVHDYHFKK